MIDAAQFKAIVEKMPCFPPPIRYGSYAPLFLKDFDIPECICSKLGIPDVLFKFRVEPGLSREKRPTEYVSVRNENGGYSEETPLPYGTLLNYAYNLCSAKKQEAYDLQFSNIPNQQNTLSADELTTTFGALKVFIDRCVDENCRTGKHEIVGRISELGYIPLQRPTNAASAAGISINIPEENSTHKIRSLADIVYLTYACVPTRLTIKRCKCSAHGLPCNHLYLSKSTSGLYCYFPYPGPNDSHTTCHYAMLQRSANEQTIRAANRALDNKITNRLARRKDSHELNDYKTQKQEFEASIDRDIFREDLKNAWLVLQDGQRRLR